MVKPSFFQTSYQSPLLPLPPTNSISIVCKAKPKKKPILNNIFGENLQNFIILHGFWKTHQKFLYYRLLDENPKIPSIMSRLEKTYKNFIYFKPTTKIPKQFHPL